jgi:hypothetical protein
VSPASCGAPAREERVAAHVFPDLAVLRKLWGGPPWSERVPLDPFFACSPKVALGVNIRLKCACRLRVGLPAETGEVTLNSAAGAITVN